MVEIIKGVPMPESRRGALGYGYPWKNMEVGDAFVKDDRQSERSFRQSAWVMGKTHGRKFSVRRISSGKLMCWRTK